MSPIRDKHIHYMIYLHILCENLEYDSALYEGNLLAFRCVLYMWGGGQISRNASLLAL